MEEPDLSPHALFPASLPFSFFSFFFAFFAFIIVGLQKNYKDGAESPYTFTQPPLILISY